MEPPATFACQEAGRGPQGGGATQGAAADGAAKEERTAPKIQATAQRRPEAAGASI